MLLRELVVQALKNNQMSKIFIQTDLQHISINQVVSGFDINLFKALTPPLVGLKVDRFDGCKVGDEVHLRVGFLYPIQKWVSLITYSNQTNDTFDFVDEGRVLPFPLKYWRHHHIVGKNKKGIFIVDSIEYKTYFKPLDLLLYPLFFMQFYYRKGAYRKYFARQNS
jgi:ligand-binding SRPBCC domain-containing protein